MCDIFSSCILFHAIVWVCMHGVRPLQIHKSDENNEINKNNAVALNGIYYIINCIENWGFVTEPNYDMV